MLQRRPRILIVDLNFFARFPTLCVGYLVAVLRRAGYEVEILSPLAFGVPSVVREKVEGPLDHLERRISYSTRAWIDPPRRMLSRLRSGWRRRPDQRIVEELGRSLSRSPDLVLISTYLERYPLCVQICEAARERGVPVLLGGASFNYPEDAEFWSRIPGLNAVVGSEVEEYLPQLVDAAITGGDLTQYPGVIVPGGAAGPPPTPLARLDDVPFPDFTDFPWHLYPNRIIPAITGRGCGWAACKFCHDVHTVNGRTFRSRSVDNVLDELAEQSDRHASKSFNLLDIKLNSDLDMWDGLISGMQERVPGAQWIGTVHVGNRGRNGLSRDELFAAREAGFVRTTFGLESGSQRVLDSIDKGCDLEGNAEFLRNASDAGISVRTTVFHGWPGETAEDLEKTNAYLLAHAKHIDRVRPNRFNVRPGTRFHNEYRQDPTAWPGISNIEFDWEVGTASYDYAPMVTADYRRAMRRFLGVIYEINRKPLKDDAQQFDGLM